MEKDPKKPTNRQVVTQSNSLINGKYELTELQQKIILLAIAQVDSKNDDEFFKFTFTIKELEQCLKIKKINEKQLYDSCIDLFKKPLSARNSKGWIVLNWFSSVKYITGESRIEFKISDEMKPYLLKLKGNFTKIQLENAIKFNGKYTTRFYQFLMKLQNTAERKEKYELNELYEMLMLPKSMRVFGQFKRNVLDPSIKEITSKTDIKASYEIGRTGRKYTSITLSYKPKNKEQTTKARAKATKKFTNKQLEKYKGVEFFYKDMFNSGVVYICENFTIAPDINKERGDGEYCAKIKGSNGVIFYDTVKEFEAAIRLAKEKKTDQIQKDRSKEMTDLLKKVTKK
ncbi:replication initiation protein [Campylobacter fetus]|uniref:replication initiation protein n=1 Tax=Campylobacter fetus TaxID=196 RepID=UPI00122EA835|nr:replication initiation protein [Campylobacter fetus]KAA3684595.1 RepB family plasmid replication initiator protein [Campylobacter fetus subsp. fetus]